MGEGASKTCKENSPWLPNSVSSTVLNLYNHTNSHDVQNNRTFKNMV